MSNHSNSLQPSEEKGYTPVSSLDGIHERLLKTFYSGKTKDVKLRKEPLMNLAYLIQDNSDELTGKRIFLLGNLAFPFIALLYIYVSVPSEAEGQNVAFLFDEGSHYLANVVFSYPLFYDYRGYSR